MYRVRQSGSEEFRRVGHMGASRCHPLRSMSRLALRTILPLVTFLTTWRESLQSETRGQTRDDAMMPGRRHSGRHRTALAWPVASGEWCPRRAQTEPLYTASAVRVAPPRAGPRHIHVQLYSCIERSVYAMCRSYILDTTHTRVIMNIRNINMLLKFHLHFAHTV